MTTLHERHQISNSNQSESRVEPKGAERREFRRHDMQYRGLPVERWDGKRRLGKPFGEIVDLSAGGMRLRTQQTDVRPDHQIRVRLELPAYAGICPFVDTRADNPQPSRQWVGWMTVSRVQRISDNETDIAGQLVDMDEMDRGMLGLYLSTQPLAA